LLLLGHLALRARNDSCQDSRFRFYYSNSLIWQQVPSHSIRLIDSRISILFQLVCKVGSLVHMLAGHFVLNISDTLGVENKKDMLCTLSLFLWLLLLLIPTSWWQYQTYYGISLHRLLHLFIKVVWCNVMESCSIFRFKACFFRTNYNCFTSAL